jgi:hypothetical protein
MKKAIVIIFAILLAIPYLQAQTKEQKIIEKFIITDARINGGDITPHLLENQAYIIFYTSGDDERTFMANV